MKKGLLALFALGSIVSISAFADPTITTPSSDPATSSVTTPSVAPTIQPNNTIGAPTDMAPTTDATAPTTDDMGAQDLGTTDNSDVTGTDTSPDTSGISDDDDDSD